MEGWRGRGMRGLGRGFGPFRGRPFQGRGFFGAGRGHFVGAGRGWIRDWFVVQEGQVPNSVVGSEEKKLKWQVRTHSNLLQGVPSLMEHLTMCIFASEILGHPVCSQLLCTPIGCLLINEYHTGY